ncbi:MAG: hypothetical protein ACJAZS_000123 [Alteromonas naphthalenivorans]|jgi:hypothetical protein
MKAQALAGFNSLEQLYLKNNQLNQEQKDQIKTQVPANCYMPYY